MERNELLRGLIAGTLPPADAVKQLARFGWDPDGPLVQVGAKDATDLLREYLAGERTREDIEEWAEALEGREDVEYEERHSQALGDFIFELANPVLNRHLTHKSATEWIERFERPSAERRGG